MNSKIFDTALLILLIILSMGCAPEVGSEAWCEQLKTQPKGDWTMNEASDFAKHCIFKGTEKSD